MESERSQERELLRGAFSPPAGCPALDRLELCLDSAAAPAELAAHIAACTSCRAELELLRAFHAPPRDAEEADAIRQVVERMRRPVVPAPEPVRSSWWKAAFHTRWLSQGALAAAAVLVLVAAGLEFRHGAPPQVSGPVAGEHDVLRSGALAVTAPIGDVGSVPSEIRWSTVGGASEYRVRLLEVDETEVWSAATRESHIAIPPEVRARIVPAKTLLVEVAALDASGKSFVGFSTVRFRLLQKVYTR